MTYTFECDTGTETFKVLVAFLPDHPVHLGDGLGFWRCLPGHLAIDKGGCDYYRPRTRLNLWDREPTPFSSTADFDTFPSTLIAKLYLPRRWEHLVTGDHGSMIYYPYGAGLKSSIQSSNGWVSRSGRWTAKEGFTGSWPRRTAEAAGEAARKRS